MLQQWHQQFVDILTGLHCLYKVHIPLQVQQSLSLALDSLLAESAACLFALEAAEHFGISRDRFKYGKRSP